MNYVYYSQKTKRTAFVLPDKTQLQVGMTVTYCRFCKLAFTSCYKRGILLNSSSISQPKTIWQLISHVAPGKGHSTKPVGCLQEVALGGIWLLNVVLDEDNEDVKKRRGIGFCEIDDKD
ncbi:hypothetical protein CDAR_230951 [Caerostris darwini]|uniref:Uncharacterized protein n=1 Tax=Caerostris darwini TaxID=1538125 RepID=A0AAV4S1F2_9ARAC|nr:hypothetical protein CDAR_230951 [Caerostris darwini]